MCSFTITNKNVNLLDTNFLSQKRGADLTNTLSENNISFLHNLLHLTGDKSKQPFYQDDIYCVFNGEIYNYKTFGDYKTDGECLIPLYQEFGLEFTRKLDGEFAICIIDFKNNFLIMVNDTFSTKPIWFSKQENFFGVSSYESSLILSGFTQIKKLSGNTAYKIDLETLKEIEVIRLKEFDLNQHKDTYDDWITAFENSITKRVDTTKGIFLGLSAGYDSGAITCELVKQNIDFTAYTILSSENRNIINDRHSTLKSGEIIELSRTEYNEVQNYLTYNCEDFVYQDYNIKNDKASKGLGAICSRANKNNQRVYLSGQGADEIISDYGFNGNKIYNHSQFGGKFPSDLNGFFPWNSFYDGTQIKYLNKEEYVAGAYGIETRYPFLDNDLVQEFLWLSSNLKNKKYKAPLTEYLERNNYPFENGVKTGFRADTNLI
jgi:asparagine synthetase B (glutamine-hydrolysing)